MTSFGQELKREREARGISLKEIADFTRISLKFLVALEDDRQDLLPGRFFNKAILRSYAGFLGLDENDILQKYEDARLPGNETETGTGEIMDGPRSGLRSGKNWLSAGLVAVIFLAVCAAYLILRSEKEAPEPRSVRQPSLSVQAEPIPPPPLQPQAEPETEGVQLDIHFIAETWISLTADGELKLRGNIPAGRKFAVKALKELAFNLGNAGGIVYSLNGKPGKPFGRLGAVVNNIRFTPENFRDFLQTPAEAREDKGTELK